MLEINDINNDINNLTFQDLVLLKQFLGKGVSEKIFNEQELIGVELELKKINNIINQVIENLQEKLE